MPLLINVPYSDKDEAKRLGAKWDPNLKSWYVETKQEYYKFIKWMLNGNDKINIICDDIYIVMGERVCYKCKKKTQVFAIAFDNYFSIYNMDSNIYNSMVPIEYYSDTMTISSIPVLPHWLNKIFKNSFNCYLDYSKSIKSEYVANHCFHCNALQGDNYLFVEPGAPFSLQDFYSYDNSKVGEKLKLFRIKLDFDILVDLSFHYIHDDESIMETYSEIVDLEI